MSTLKKVLALSLVFVMAFSFMAGAAFTDQDKISQKAAVDFVSALGIMVGYPDGTFQPDKIVTRAEAAKMVYVIKNQGVDDGAAYYKSALNPFTDTVGTWAQGYINYCYSIGIVAGVGGGKFEPDAPLTGLQLAKMCLVLLGYDAKSSGLTGSQWILNTANLATNKALFVNYSGSIADGASRDNTACIFNNALKANTVALNPFTGLIGDEIDMTTGAFKGITLAEKALNVKELKAASTVAGAQVILKANDNFGYNVAAAASGKSQINDGANNYTLDIDSADAYVGQEVKVYYKDADRSSSYTNGDSVVALYPTTKNVVKVLTKGAISSTASDFTTKANGGEKIKSGGVTYTMDAAAITLKNYLGGAPIATDGTGFDTYGLANFSAKSNDTVTLIDNDGDAKYEFINIEETTIGKIAGVTSDKLSISSSLAWSAIKISDTDIYSGYALNDYVIVKNLYQAKGVSGVKYVVEPTTKVEAEVTGKSGGDKVLINGSYVTISNLSGAAANVFATDDVTTVDGISLNKTYTFYTDGTYWIAAKGIASTTTYAVITAIDGTTNIARNAEVLLSDGTKGVYAIGEIWTTSKQAISYDLKVGQVVQYSILSTGKLKLTVLSAAGVADTTAFSYDYATKLFTPDGGTTKMPLASDAVIFYLPAGGSWKVAKASDLTATSGTFVSVAATPANTQYYAKKTSNTIDYVKVASFTNVAAAPAADSSTVYGYLTKDIDIVKSGDDYIYTYTYWNGSATVSSALKLSSYTDVVADGSTYATSAGQYIKFSLKADGTINEAAPLAKVTGTDGKVLDYVADSNLLVVNVAGTTKYLKLDSKTKVIYIDVSAKSGTTSSGFAKYDSVNDYPNVRFIVDGTDANLLKAIFVDVGNNLK